jgi:ankyrin repeat protein
MSTSLPEQPDLDQLRRRAKELRDAARRDEAGAVERFARHHGSASQGAVSLAAAQLVIARELGFASWPRLKAAVDANAASPVRRAEAFVAASVDGRLREAAKIFDAFPDMASHGLNAAAVLGDAEQVARMLAVDPAAAVAIDEVRGWPPLLYACYSGWGQIDPRRAAGLFEVVRLLLDAGASPNTNDGARYPRSALKGSVEANNPDMTRILLEAGANPDVGQPIGEAVGRADHRCLELLLSYGARVAGTWAVGAAVFHDDARAVALLMEALGADAGQAKQQATDALSDAAASASPVVVAALLAAGADPNAHDENDVSALRLAVRAGKNETAALLASRGAPDDSTDIDRFIGACRRADRVAAEKLLAAHPDLRGRLTDDDSAALFEAANSASGDALNLMLELGFSPHVRNGFGEQPLHTAAYAGNAEAVRYLLDAGADVLARDSRFEATPLAFATVGSGEQAGHQGSWIDVIRLLVSAGAARDGVWIASKPPSEDVAELLLSYGISPDDEAEPQPEDPDDPPLSLGTGVMADIARHLEAAYRNLDLEVLGSLLHPEVRWSGECSTSAEVLAWYRRLLADGMQASLESMEVDQDAVILCISVAGRAEGARPAPAQRIFQVFTIDNNEIVEIRGYPDRRSAIARTRGTG